MHREVQALFGGGTVETCHGDMVRRHFPTLRKVQTHSLADRLSSHFQKNGIDRNKLNIQQIIFRKTLWTKACVQIGAFTIRATETRMCIYL